MSWKWPCKNSNTWRTLFTQLQLPGKSQEGNVIFQIGIQSFSLPNCCLGAMKFLLTIRPQDLIINAMWLLPITKSVPPWGCEKHSFVNQGGRSLQIELHLPCLRAHFFLCNSVSKWCSKLIICDLFSLLFYSTDWALYLEQIGTEPSSCHTRTSLEN